MTHQRRKMSEILKEMSERLLRNPDAVPSSQAAHVALMFGNIAWNETVDMGHPREKNRRAWERIEADNPEMWSEFKSNDVDAMIDELVRFKKQHHPDDRRRILSCGIPDGKVRVEWLPHRAPQPRNWMGVNLRPRQGEGAGGSGDGVMGLRAGLLLIRTHS